MRKFAVAALLACAALPSLAAERWETLPPTPTPIATDRSGEAEANGVKIHYAIYGQGSPVIFLHGGLANTDYRGACCGGASYRDPDGQPRTWPQHPRCAPLRL
jgi:hypothetical protein